MTARVCQVMCIMGWLVGIPCVAGQFVPPAEGPIAFRRDRIPLDVETMNGLSRQLESLADEMNPANAMENRSVAQLLALSLALDPANNKARRLLVDYQHGRHRPAGEHSRLEKNRGRVWQTIDWLETPEAGGQARALAACLKDVLAVSDSGNPRSASVQQAGEKGAWTGWIPPLSAYEAVAPVVAGGDPQKKPIESITNNGTATPKTLKLLQASVSTVLWSKHAKDEAGIWTLAPVSLRMKAESVEPGQPGGDEFNISIGPEQESNPFEQTEEKIERLLSRRYGELPKGVRIKIGCSELETTLASEKRHSISAAAALLASAAITGIEPDAIIIGDIAEGGVLKLPMGFWDQLQSLGKGTGRRLVLPMDAAAYLPALLAMEKPEFFLQYEVLLASDFNQLLELTAKSPQGELADSIAKFREVQNRMGTLEIRQYIANPYVRQRLVTIFQECPVHMSAKLLVIQAAGSRPVIVPRNILASEIRRALEPVSWLVRKDDDVAMSEAANLTKSYENCRVKVDALERYAERKDRDLIERARVTLTGIRSIEKGLKARGEYLDNLALANSARYEFRKSMRELGEALNSEMGEGQAKVNH